MYGFAFLYGVALYLLLKTELYSIAKILIDVLLRTIMPLNFGSFKLQRVVNVLHSRRALPCGKECHPPENRQFLGTYAKIPCQ